VSTETLNLSFLSTMRKTNLLAHSLTLPTHKLEAVLSVNLQVAKKTKRIMDKRAIQMRSQRVKRQTSQNTRVCECYGRVIIRASLPLKYANES